MSRLPIVGDGPDDVSGLIARLHEIEQNLEAATSGEVDSVIGPDGRNHLLHSAQTELRRRESELHLVARGLQQEHARLVAAQAVAKIGSWTIDPEVEHITWSKEMHTLFGTDPETFELRLDAIMSRIHADDRAGLEAALAASRADLSACTIDHRIVHADGSIKHVEVACQAMHDPADGRLRIIGTSQDITLRKQAERAARETQALLSTASRVARMGAFKLDYSRSKTYLSNEACAIYGIPPGGTLSLDERLAHYSPPHREAVRQAVRECAENGVPYDLELELEARYGQVKWIRVLGERSADTEEDGIWIQGALQDITQRKQIELEAKSLAARLSNIVESITDGFCTVDDAWLFRFHNSHARTLLRRGSEDLLGHSLWDVMPDAFHTALGRGLRDVMASREDATFEAFHEPWQVWFQVSAYPSEGGLTIYFRDINEQKKERLQLDLLEASVARISDIVIITKADRIDGSGPEIVFVNDAFVRQTGYSRAEVIGQTPRLLQGPLTERTELDRIRAALTRFEPIRAEIVNYWKDGNPVWLELNITPLTLTGERTTHFVSVERNITERRRDQDALRALNANLEERVAARTLELSRAREEAESANRAKSSFLATMSHEIRTPMNGVLGMIEVLEQSALQSAQREMTSLIRESAFSLLGIIDGILDFSKIEAGRLALACERFSLASLVENVTATLEPIAQKQRVTLTVFVDPKIPDALTGDSLRLRQVLVNLVGNAVKFSGGREQRGHVSVRALLHRRESEAAWVDLAVVDDGIGIHADAVRQLFVPFSQGDESTTRRYGGTGLGLAVSNLLVKLMGGEVLVLSEHGRGATFTVRVPLAVAAEAPPAVPGPLQGLGGVHAVVVGMNARIESDLRAYLQAAGATVSACAELPDALALTREGADNVCIVRGGPEASGPQAFRRSGEIRSGTSFVVIEEGLHGAPRKSGEGVVRLGGDLVMRRGLIDAVALATGRLPTARAAGATAARPGALTLSSAARAALGGPILVAEDNETNRIVIQKQLGLLGLEAELAVDGRDALTRWRRGRHALVLTDLHMPELDGYGLVEQIRAEEQGPRRVRIGALTANALAGEERRCLSLGMDAYLTKPLALGSLRDALEAMLGPRAGEEAQVPAGEPPGAAPAASADLAVLASMVGDVPEVIRSVVAAFETSGRDTVREIEQAVAAASARRMREAAHKLKSGARLMGAGRLSDLCVKVEAFDPATGWKAAAALQRELGAEFAAVLRCVDRELAQGVERE